METKSISTISVENIQNNIFTMRGKQVILDKDLAEIYGTSTRSLKQSVRRNPAKFPSDFMFKLTDEEIDLMVSQSVIPSKSYFGGAVPFAFTEQGVAMLSSAIQTPIAVKTRVQIIRAFIRMKRFINTNAKIFQRLEYIEAKQINTDNNVEIIINSLESNTLKPKQGIFYDGEMFDAYVFVIKLIKAAKKRIILIDNYINEDTLQIFSVRQSGVSCQIYTSKLTQQVQLDVARFNSQYSNIEIHKFAKSHDRFLIIDNNDIYHIGASLKDLGKKWFAFSKLDIDSFGLLDRLV